jgi:hypothetical protein
MNPINAGALQAVRHSGWPQPQPPLPPDMVALAQCSLQYCFPARVTAVPETWHLHPAWLHLPLATMLTSSVLSTAAIDQLSCRSAAGPRPRERLQAVLTKAR